MLEFKTPLIARALSDGVNWSLHEPLVVDLGFPIHNDFLIIPKGFVTDFGSVPKVLQLFVNPQGKAKAAFVLHDYLYRVQVTTQLMSDSFLNEGMIVLGVNWFQRFMVYRGLRIGGWSAWSEYKRKLGRK
jgi:hypothetical protein